MKYSWWSSAVHCSPAPSPQLCLITVKSVIPCGQPSQLGHPMALPLVSRTNLGKTLHLPDPVNFEIVTLDSWTASRHPQVT